MLRNNLLLNFFGQAWSSGMNLLFIPLYVHYMGIETYALVGFFSVITTWLCLLDMGMTPSISREMARYIAGARSAETTRDLMRSVEIIVFGIALVIIIFFIFLAPWLVDSWLRIEGISKNNVIDAITMMGIVVALRFFEDIYRSALIGLQKQVLLNGLLVLTSTLRGVGSVGVLAFLSNSIYSFFLWQALISLISACLLACATYFSLKPILRHAQFSVSVLREISSYAGGVMSITLLSLLLTQVDKVLLSKLLSLKDFGYYTIASVVSGALFSLTNPISQAWSPRLAELYARKDHEGLIRVFHQGAQTVTILIGTVCTVLFFYSDMILQLWTSNIEIEKNAAKLLGLLAIGNFLNTLLWIPYQVQLAYGWTRLTIYTNAFAVIFLVPAFFWTIPRYGAKGAAILWIILNLCYLTISIQLMFRKILTAEKWKWYFRDIIIPLAATFLVVALIDHLVPFPKNSVQQIALITISIFFGLVASTLSSSNIRHNVIFNLQKFIR